MIFPHTSPHNYVFLENAKTAIASDPAWMAGEYRAQPTKDTAFIEAAIRELLEG